MSQPITVRLEERTAEELRLTARRERRSVSEIGGRYIEEGVRQNRFSYIEFRSINGERVACVKGRLEVWQVLMVAKGVDNDVARIAEHLDLRPEQVQSALSYYEAYPAEIDQALEDNSIGYERLKERLPNLKLFIVPLGPA